MSSNQNLGTEESAEVWFIPSSSAYEARVLTILSSIEDAREYVAQKASIYAGRLEIVRSTTTRQRVI